MKTASHSCGDRPRDREGWGDAPAQYVIVLMPFEDRFNDVLRGAIEPAVRKAGLRCLRVDQIGASTSIPNDVEHCVDQAVGAIVDVTGNRPNVMFELGLVRGRDKPVIVITQSKELPFDIHHLRVI